MAEGRLDVGRLDAARTDTGTIDAGRIGAGNIEKTERLKAGNLLIQGLSKRVEEQKQILEKEVREKEEEKEEVRQESIAKGASRDVSRLSEQGRWIGICKDWVLEMESELWEAFLNWFPLDGKSLSDQLEELSTLYLKLLESILTHTEEGPQQQEQLRRLASVLSEKLNLLIGRSVKDLLEFAEEFGDKEAVRNIRGSLYRNVTKESIPGREAKTFFEKGTIPERSEGTVLYARSGKGEVQVDKSYRTYVSENRAAFAMSPAERETAGVMEASQGKRGELYTGRQLETADRFAGYIRGSGNLLDPGRRAETVMARPGSQREEGIKGVLAAAMDIKAEVFYDSVKASSTNISSRAGERRTGGIFAEVRDMVGRMVDRYIVEAEQRERAVLRQEAGDAAGGRNPGRSVRDVYYYIMNIYRKTGEPEEALAAGIKYAMQQEGWIAGARFLNRDWEQFLRVIGQQKGADLTRYMEKYSPWGILKGGEEQQLLGKKGISRALMLGLAGVIAGILLLILL